jgi:hypothetical protein
MNQIERSILDNRKRDLEFTKKLHPELNIQWDEEAELKKLRADMERVKDVRFSYSYSEEMKMMNDNIINPYGRNKSKLS